MIANLDRIHIGLDSAEFLADFYEAAKKGGQFDEWNLAARARPGDTVVVYIQSPVSSFIGTCTVDSEEIPRPPNKKRRSPNSWFQVRDAITLPNGPVHLQTLKTHFGKRWPYLIHPTVTCMPHKTAPIAIVREFLDELSLNDVAIPEEGVLEDLSKEAGFSRKSLNRSFRYQAIVRSKGICEACEVDYSKVLGGRGRRVLHVHHRQQRAVQDTPVITTYKDLNKSTAAA